MAHSVQLCYNGSIELQKTYSRSDLSDKKLAFALAKLASDYKGFNIRICNVNSHCSFASYFVVVSCTSSRQTTAIADAMVARFNVNPASVEGRGLGEWVLVDLGDVIVHIFDESTRDFYMLDRTWGHVPSELYVDPETPRQAFVASPA